jgi:HD-GYP domain-containing protein (c-di-GMP phosphodiesterase class II)
VVARARGLLKQEAGRQFDERCVSALERVLAREAPELAVAS